MRLAISNIAWDPAEDDAIARLLGRCGIDAIDVAPSKYFAAPREATDEDISLVRRRWAESGIEITGMQALLFGTDGLNMFGTPGTQQAMLQHLDAVCRIGRGLGAKRLVFGSPKHRDRGSLSDAEAHDIAIPFFGRLGEIAESHGVLICLEPSPARYSANFMTTTAETARVVELVDHPAIRLQLDTGALTINEEDPGEVLRDHAPLVGHVHASEPDLLPLGDADADHASVCRALEQHLPDHLVCIEMLATKQEGHEASIERAISVAVRNYRRPGIGACT